MHFSNLWVTLHEKNFRHHYRRRRRRRRRRRTSWACF